MSGPYRLGSAAPARFGAAIDRTEPVGFRLGGSVLSGLYGDTLASALLSSGVRTLGASAFLGRPRGVIGLGLESATRLVLEDGSGWETVPADAVAVREGAKVRLQGTGLGRALRRFAPPLATDRRTLPIAQQMLDRVRRSVPLPSPRMPASEAQRPARMESCDVLVIGAGLAGLAAAARLRNENLNVLAIDSSARAGGAADLYDGTIDGLAVTDWVARQAGDLSDRRRLLLQANAVTIGRDGDVSVIERRPGGDALRLISARAVVVATGFRERPLVFPGNDRPGVMLAGTARALLRRYAIAPGARVIVATLGDEGYRTAFDLREAGVAVELVVDARENPQGAAVDLAKAAGVPVALASLVSGLEFEEKREEITGVRTQNRDGDGASSGARVRPADALVVSGGFAPRGELLFSCGLGAEQGVHAALAGPNAIDAVAAGWAAAGAAAAQLGRPCEDRAAPKVAVTADEDGEPQAFSPASFTSVGAATAFVDFDADVTLADLARAVDRWGAAPAAIARNLRLGLSADGGRLSADLPRLALAALIGDGTGLPGPSAGRLTLGQMAARAASGA